MTLEEKRELLEAYCERIPCEKCPLCIPGMGCEVVFDTADEEELDYAITKVDGIDGSLFNDSVNHPKHYTDGKIEVIEYIEDKKLGFCLGNAVKYISRAGKKDPDKEIEDLKKAIWYLERRITEIKEGG